MPKVLDGDVEVLKSILQNAKALNASDKIINFQDGLGRSLLLLAIQKGNLQVAVSLIQHGADVNASTNSGNTPLIEASARRYISVVKKLIERGARLTQKDEQSPFITAVKNSPTDVAEYLLSVSTLSKGKFVRIT